MPDTGINPLCCTKGFDPALQFKWCSMHIVNLGTLQVLNGSVLTLMFEHSCFAFDWSTLKSCFCQKL